MCEITPSVLLQSRVALKQTQALLSKNKLPCELTLEPFNNLSTALPKVLAKFKLKTSTENIRG